MKKFTISGKVCVWPGEVGWHFVYVDKDTALKISKYKKSHSRGFVKIRATLGKTSWDTSLFPYKREDTYLLALKKATRQKESVFDGDMVKVKIQLL